MDTLELHDRILARLQECNGREMRLIDALLDDLQWLRFCRMWWRLTEWG